jgi:hypothetical protein
VEDFMAERPDDNFADRPERDGAGPMIAILLAGALMLLGTIGGAVYFVVRAARNTALREHEAVVAAQFEAETAHAAALTSANLATVSRLLATGAGCDQDVRAADGRPLLSWRVALLSKSEKYAELYRQFKLDEPWDGPNNRNLIERMPDMYAPPPDRNVRGGITYFRGFSHEGAAFAPNKLQRRPWNDFSAGRSEILTVVEAAVPIEWTRPDAWQWPPGEPRPPLGGIFPGRPTFLAATADGRVHTVKHAIPDDTLRLLFEIRKERRSGIQLTGHVRE